MRILVTGGTGYLGQAVVRRLAAMHEVVLFGRSVTGSRLDATGVADSLRGVRLQPDETGGARATGAGAGERADNHDSSAPAPRHDVTAVAGDIRDAAALAQAARHCDVILHMAALVAVWRRIPAEFDEVNVGGLRHVLDAARAGGVQRVVYTASFLAPVPGGLDAAPAWNDYQRTKAAADALASRAVAAGAPLVRLYPGVIYGPGPLTAGNLVGRQIADHLAGRLPGVVGADRLWSFAHVDDVAEAHVAAVEGGQPGASYQLGGENVPQIRPFEIVRALTGRPLPRRLPAWLAAVAATADELRAAVTGRPPALTTGTLEILLRDWPLDSTPATHDLGYRITPLEEGIRTVVEPLRPTLPR